MTLLATLFVAHLDEVADDISLGGLIVVIAGLLVVWSSSGAACVAVA